MDRKLDSLPAGVDKQTVARVLDCCDIASQRQEVKFTDFLDPFHREFVGPLIKNYFGIRFTADGGYQDAEQQRLAIFPDYYRPDDIEIPLALMEITLSDPARHLNHRDYLGAVLGLGLRRGVVGDIIAFPGGGQVFVAGEVGDALMGLEEVNRFSVTVRQVPPYAVRITQQPQKTISATVASLRLDAVLSAGLGIGRSKAADLVRSDRVRVNWRQITQPSFPVAEGTVISIRGRGRLQVAEVGSATKKGRTRITLKKYV